MCDDTFKRRGECIEHMKENDYHVIVEKGFKSRLMDGFHGFLIKIMDLPWESMRRTAGWIIILTAIEHHFKINFTSYESILFGLGVGLVIR